MPLARASELDRLLACSGSAWLHRAESRSGIAAAWGTKVHSWAETGQLPAGLDGVALEKRIKASETSRLALWPEDGQREVAMAYNVVRNIATTCTSTEPGYKDRWKAAFDDEWITGTCDYVADVFGDPWVDDLKTGRQVHWKDYEAQQSFYVLAWCMADRGELVQSRSTITHWPRYPVAVKPNRFGTTLDVEYLMLFRGKLQHLRTEILAGRQQPEIGLLFTGDQCKYCPSRGTCPKLSAQEEQN